MLYCPITLQVALYARSNSWMLGGGGESVKYLPAISLLIEKVLYSPAQAGNSTCFSKNLSINQVSFVSVASWQERFRATSVSYVRSLPTGLSFIPALQCITIMVGSMHIPS